MKTFENITKFHLYPDINLAKKDRKMCSKYWIVSLLKIKVWGIFKAFMMLLLCSSSYSVITKATIFCKGQGRLTLETSWQTISGNLGNSSAPWSYLFSLLKTLSLREFSRVSDKQNSSFSSSPGYWPGSHMSSQALRQFAEYGTTFCVLALKESYISQQGWYWVQKKSY